MTNQKGEGVSAALGLEVVDQAVFALAEKQPGFAKVFFYLEQELLKPRYEIHAFTPDQIVEPQQGESAESRDRAARVLFSAAGTLMPDSLDTEAGRELPQSQAADYHVRYQDAYLEYVRDLTTRIRGCRNWRKHGRHEVSGRQFEKIQHEARPCLEAEVFRTSAPRWQMVRANPITRWRGR